MKDNPFERFDLDPRAGPRALTERLRELVEEAATEERRAEIRAAWEELTMHPARRLALALGAHPESRPELAGGPPPRKDHPPPPPLALVDVAPRIRVSAALPPRVMPAAQAPEGLDGDPVLEP